MDAVVLAGGRNGRLSPAVTPFSKPLLAVGGEPLVAGGVRIATAASHPGGRVVVVAAPQNERLLAALVRAMDGWDERRCSIVVQAAPRGPGDALLVALRRCHRPSVLVCMADTVMARADEDRLVRELVATDASSRARDGLFLVTVTKAATAADVARCVVVAPDGRVVPRPTAAARWPDGAFRSCVGPFVVPREAMLTDLAARCAGEAGELGLEVFRLGRRPQVVEIACTDAGISPPGQARSPSSA